MINPNYVLAIIGLGPRGHYALECYLREREKLGLGQDFEILLFEETDELGNGPVWDTRQPASNWSNINDRSLDLPERPEIVLGELSVPAFPSYHDWRDLSPSDIPQNSPDIYPPRKMVGDYLSERFESLITPLLEAGCAELVRDRVDFVSPDSAGVCIKTKSGSAYLAEQTLLTVGHQKTHRDAQIRSWQDELQGAEDAHLFEDPYPVDPVIDALKGMANIDIAVRGYGLATIDILRAISDHAGAFTILDEQTRVQSFRPNENLSLNIFPFSLDGLPMGPKPLTSALDQQFAPEQALLDELFQHLSDQSSQAAASGKAFLLDALAPIIASVFRKLDWSQDGAPPDNKDLQNLIKSWVCDQSHSHPCILDTNRPPVELLKRLVAMAIGDAAVSLDYCIGQVWRHCHPTIYGALSHGAFKSDVLAEIISMDEGMKRYAFGPPAESLQQLIALAESGVLNLDFVNNPDIEVTPEGWVLSNGTGQAKVSMLVDAVLDAPDVKDVDSKLISCLLEEGGLSIADEDLGITTDEAGYVIASTGDMLPIAVLGRLAKGTIIGVDAILECFGSRPQAWAVQAALRNNPAPADVD